MIWVFSKDCPECRISCFLLLSLLLFASWFPMPRPHPCTPPPTCAYKASILPLCCIINPRFPLLVRALDATGHLEWETEAPQLQRVCLWSQLPRGRKREEWPGCIHLQSPSVQLWSIFVICQKTPWSACWRWRGSWEYKRGLAGG